MPDQPVALGHQARALPPILAEYANSPDKQRQLHAKTMKVVILSQMLAGSFLSLLLIRVMIGVRADRS